MVPIFSKRLSVDAIEKSHFSLHSKGKSKGNKIVLKFLPIIGSKKNSSPTCLLIFLIFPFVCVLQRATPWSCNCCRKFADSQMVGEVVIKLFDVTSRPASGQGRLADISAVYVGKGRIKRGVAGQLCGKILADFEAKRAEKGLNF
jgi:hypothetical protein